MGEENPEVSKGLAFLKEAGATLRLVIDIVTTLVTAILAVAGKMVLWRQDYLLIKNVHIAFMVTMVIIGVWLCSNPNPQKGKTGGSRKTSSRRIGQNSQSSSASSPPTASAASNAQQTGNVQNSQGSASSSPTASAASNAQQTEEKKNISNILLIIFGFILIVNILFFMSYSDKRIAVWWNRCRGIDTIFLVTDDPSLELDKIKNYLEKPLKDFKTRVEFLQVPLSLRELDTRTIIKDNLANPTIFYISRNEITVTISKTPEPLPYASLRGYRQESDCAYDSANACISLGIIEYVALKNLETKTDEGILGLAKVWGMEYSTQSRLLEKYPAYLITLLEITQRTGKSFPFRVDDNVLAEFLEKLWQSDLPSETRTIIGLRYVPLLPRDKENLEKAQRILNILNIPANSRYYIDTCELQGTVYFDRALVEPAGSSQRKTLLEQSKETFNNLRSRAPDSPSILLGLGKVHLYLALEYQELSQTDSRKEIRSAIDILRQASGLANDAPCTQSRIETVLGTVYYLDGDPLSQTAFENALSLSAGCDVTSVLDLQWLPGGLLALKFQLPKPINIAFVKLVGEEKITSLLVEDLDHPLGYKAILPMSSIFEKGIDFDYNQSEHLFYVKPEPYRDTLGLDIDNNLQVIKISSWPRAQLRITKPERSTLRLGEYYTITAEIVDGINTPPYVLTESGLLDQVEFILLADYLPSTERSVFLGEYPQREYIMSAEITDIGKYSAAYKVGNVGDLMLTVLVRERKYGVEASLLPSEVLSYSVGPLQVPAPRLQVRSEPDCTTFDYGGTFTITAFLDGNLPGENDSKPIDDKNLLRRYNFYITTPTQREKIPMIPMVDKPGIYHSVSLPAVDWTGERPYTVHVMSLETENPIMSSTITIQGTARPIHLALLKPAQSIYRSSAIESGVKLTTTNVCEIVEVVDNHQVDEWYYIRHYSGLTDGEQSYGWVQANGMVTHRVFPGDLISSTNPNIGIAIMATDYITECSFIEIVTAADGRQEYTADRGYHVRIYRGFTEKPDIDWMRSDDIVFPSYLKRFLEPYSE